MIPIILLLLLIVNVLYLMGFYTQFHNILKRIKREILINNSYASLRSFIYPNKKKHYTVLIPYLKFSDSLEKVLQLLDIPVEQFTQRSKLLRIYYRALNLEPLDESEINFFNSLLVNNFSNKVVLEGLLKIGDITPDQVNHLLKTKSKQYNKFINKR